MSRFRNLLINFSLRQPKLVIVIVSLVTMIFLAAFPQIKTDTDPVHMLHQDNPTVLLYNQLKEEFKVSDIVALGIESRDGSSLFTVDGLSKIDQITKEILDIKDKDGKSDLIVKNDVISVSTVDDIVKNSSGELAVLPLMKHPPESEKEAKYILDRLNDNPMLGGKMASKDGRLIGIFMPIVNGKKDSSYYLGEQVKNIAKKHLGVNEKFYFAGLPIAESTFGNEMFIQMSVYAPLAGLVIMILMLLFFRNFKIIIAPMLIGVMAVVWSMGSLIYSGNVIHIMSSMIPIFIMPIAVLNSIHVLSNLYDEIGKHEKKEDAIRVVLKNLFKPMLFTSVTTMIGFASLATTGIPPVIVFGVTIAWGVFLSWLLTIVFLPAYTMLMSSDALSGFGGKSNERSMTNVIVGSFKKVSFRYPKIIIIGSLILIAISYIGVTKIIINDNPVRWFKKGHALRVADVEMNKHLAGTYMANLHFSIGNEELAENNDQDDFSDVEDQSSASIKDPMVIKYISDIGEFLKGVKSPDGKNIIGGVTSIVDVLKKIGDVAVGSRDIPTSREQVSQYMFLFESGDLKRGKDMWKLITPNNSEKAQMWVYFKSGDNQNMITVSDALETFFITNPPPKVMGANGEMVPLKVEWSGLMHINKVWQHEMVNGMMSSLVGSFIIVFLMMIFLFRSIKWGLIAMLPLSITILFIYGLIGFSGKFYDMPIAVLSSLTLGLSIDFAIHFIEHAREYNFKNKNFDRTFEQLFSGTAQAIWRNVLVISIGFAPLFFAGLVPYVTVGSFFFLIMIVSGVITLVLMPAILKVFYKYLPTFKEYV